MNILNGSGLWILVLAIIWVLPWKGYALWTSARMSHKWWFIALIILNTFALLDIFYIFYIAKKTPKDIIGAFKHKI
ncbi:MAG TPA: DUF5652 family protein [Candidatus Paceibacterota bacterium]|jgi:hypothetical protein|nr:DUF5652 family protein [Candidatus Paceibacterota bacterium]